MLAIAYILNLKCIQDDSLVLDQCNLANTNKWQLRRVADTLNLDHTVTEHMDLLEPAEDTLNNRENRKGHKSNWTTSEKRQTTEEIRLLLSTLTQRTNGSPLKPMLQLQIALWLTVWQRAFIPHVPGQGSLHFWLMHDLSCEHSELTTHSGRQFGGAPVNSGKHEQTAWLFTSRHWLFKPHGDGWHGFSIGTSWTLCEIREKQKIEN